MKYFIFGTAGVITIALILGMFFYQKDEKNTSQLLNRKSENNLIQNEQKEDLTTDKELELYAEKKIDYSLENDQLNITFDKGVNWIQVPVEKDKLFNGEYRGNKQTLIDNSFVLTKDRVAFLYQDIEKLDEKKVSLIYSLNKGKTWEEAVIVEPFPSIRFRKVDFLNDDFGYVIISGDRTMSQEFSTVFLTHDGGETWEETGNSEETRLISDGGFIDENTGFLSFGTINPEEPEVYVTHDAGETWDQAVFHIPTKYDKIFVSAEIPVKEDDHLTVFVNQGPNGDYKGGKVKGKFVSKDNGETWDFAMEVEPNETEE